MFSEISSQFSEYDPDSQTMTEPTADAAIQVQDLSKCYYIYDKPQDRLKQSLVPRLQRLIGQPQRQYAREFRALTAVSFEVGKGETVGIMGRNGSGKSTLLQLICGTLSATSGSVQTNGRVSALLELGSGFNPEFSGRENVYMNATVLGLSKEEIDVRYDDIVAFADIGNFMDQPVKTYSSGMMVRLAFAVQAQVAPDILIVDEALSVGDARFQAKCFDRLKKLKERGTSILLVTHSSEQIVTHCDRAVLLESGRVLEIGHPRSLVNRYMDLLFGKEKRSTHIQSQSRDADSETGNAQSGSSLSYGEDLFATHPGYNPHEYRWGDGSASILDYLLSADDERYPVSVASGQNITLAVSFRFMHDLVCPILGITLKTKEGVTVYGVNSETLADEAFRSLGRSGQAACARASFCCRLAPGDYFISLGIATRHGEEVTPHDRRYDAIHFQVQPITTFFGLVDLDVRLSAKEVAV